MLPRLRREREEAELVLLSKPLTSEANPQAQGCPTLSPPAKSKITRSKLLPAAAFGPAIRGRKEFEAALSLHVPRDGECYHPRCATSTGIGGITS